LHALHGGGDLSRYATTLLLQDLRDAASLSVAVLGVAFKGKAIGTDGFRSVKVRSAAFLNSMAFDGSNCDKSCTLRLRLWQEKFREEG
jgi:hypothetical protein